ncbi:hypothetical protein RhiirA4_457640 [Rhizophagus irregularis]|uniref:Uncharacterized protein n=1 Tax=Rhizophagus irregularis TaxID=588596 RepID=A0A2I1GAF8_9GLOM|nr:hypothetical protein RhiirA4_457640 [Rhizophagus irregularis]
MSHSFRELGVKIPAIGLGCMMQNLHGKTRITYIYAHRVDVLSKVLKERRSEFSPDYVRQACERSLEPIEDTVGALADLVEGK